MPEKGNLKYQIDDFRLQILILPVLIGLASLDRRLCTLYPRSVEGKIKLLSNYKQLGKFCEIFLHFGLYSIYDKFVRDYNNVNKFVA
jgi:hypothetical protein